MAPLPVPIGEVFSGRRRFPLAIAVATVLWGLAFTVQAQDALLDQAAAQLRAHDAASAYALLAGEEVQRAGDPRFDYLLGVAALDAGHTTRAIFALERLVAGHPDDALARAELGRAYLAAGEPDSARAELRRVRGQDLPDGAAVAIDRVLGVIDQVAPPTGPQVSGYVEFGLGYDSNVNSASNQGEFALPGFGGILFTTEPGSRKHDDEFVTAAAGINLQLRLDPEWKVVAAANVRANANRVVDAMNTDLLDATIGVTHTSGAQSQTLALQNGTAWVDSGLYRSANGASAQWQLQLDDVSQASVFGQWSRQDYDGQADRNTDRAVLGLGYARDFSATGTLAYGSAYVASEHTQRAEYAYFGHHADGLRLGVEQRLGASFTAFAEWQHELRRYGATEPLFDLGRRDRQDDLTAGVRHSLTERWQITGQWRFTRAASNVVLYDYTRNVLQLSLHRSFP